MKMWKAGMKNSALHIESSAEDSRTYLLFEFEVVGSESSKTIN